MDQGKKSRPGARRWRERKDCENKSGGGSIDPPNEMKKQQKLWRGKRGWKRRSITKARDHIASEVTETWRASNGDARGCTMATNAPPCTISGL